MARRTQQPKRRYVSLTRGALYLLEAFRAAARAPLSLETGDWGTVYVNTYSQSSASELSDLLALGLVAEVQERFNTYTITEAGLRFEGVGGWEVD